MFKFIPDHVGGIGTKRKQEQKPCGPCKKHHKKCSHIEIPDSAAARTVVDGQSTDNTSPAVRRTTGTESSYLVDTSNVKPISLDSAPRLSGSSNGRSQPGPYPPGKEACLRFVGDLSPEASFFSNNRRQSNRRNPPRHDEVGVWLEKPEDEQSGHEKDNDEASRTQFTDNSTAHLPPLMSLQSISARLTHELLSVIPAEYELSIIMRLYYAKFDPIFPILRSEVFDDHSYMEAVVLKQCICLVAALDPSLRSQLRLPHTNRVLSPIDFRACIAATVKESLHMGLIRNRIVHLQVCALMAFYVDKANCSEVSTYYCLQAVHDCQTLGLHLGWPTMTEKSRRIFWCVWALDRLNAATNGRPIMMHRQDMDARILETYSEQEAPFRLLIRISKYLDEVITKYRPQPSATGMSGNMTDDGVTFEDFVKETDAMDIGSSLLASLEVFLLAVLILQHRPRVSSQSSQSTPSSDFQLLAASNIIDILSEDLRTSISFWPAVPYAVSLATSVAYKSLRNSNISYKRKRAFTLFHRSCDVLDDLGKSFSSALVVARLAADTMQEVERVATHRSLARKSQNRGDHLNECDGEQIGQGLSEETRAALILSSAQLESLKPVEQIQLQNATDTSVCQSSLDNIYLPGQSDLDEFIGDAGLFNDFDPDFDLDHIDLVFTSNLDPTLPPPIHHLD